MLVFAQDTLERLPVPNVPSAVASPGSRNPDGQRRGNLLLYSSSTR